jgi:hypothetical protein
MAEIRGFNSLQPNLIKKENNMNFLLFLLFGITSVYFIAKITSKWIIDATIDEIAKKHNMTKEEVRELLKK